MRHCARRSGSLNASELRRFLENELGHALSTSALQHAMRLIDADRNGEIDFEELLAWFAREADLRGGTDMTMTEFEATAARLRIHAQRMIRGTRSALGGLLGDRLSQLQLVQQRRLTRTQRLRRHLARMRRQARTVIRVVRTGSLETPAQRNARLANAIRSTVEREAEEEFDNQEQARKYQMMNVR